MPEQPGYFTVTAMPGDRWQWEMFTKRGDRVATSEVHSTPAAAHKTLDWVKANVANCPVINAKGRHQG